MAARPPRVSAVRARGARASSTRSRAFGLDALEALVDPLTRGDPMSPLRWTCKSRAKLAAALAQQGWRVSSTTVGRLLNQMGYRLQAPRKRLEGTTHPDRNAQFEYLNATADCFLQHHQPALGRHKEEGAGRKLQKCGPGMAADGRAGGGARSRCPDGRVREGDSLRGL